MKYWSKKWHFRGTSPSFLSPLRVVYGIPLSLIPVKGGIWSPAPERQRRPLAGRREQAAGLGGRVGGRVCGRVSGRLNGRVNGRVNGGRY